MTQKENAHPIAATMERAAGTAAYSGAAASFSGECSTLSRPRQTVLIADVRQLSKAVERERRRGAPICAAVSGDSRGYFLASSPDELSAYLKALDHRLREVRRTRDACGDTLRRMTGQTNLAGW